MKLSASSIATLQRTLGALVVSASAALAQTPTAPAPLPPPSAPTNVAPPVPIAPTPTADASKLGIPVDKGLVPSSIEPPLQAGGAPLPLGQPGGTVDANGLPTLPPPSPNAPRVSEFSGDEANLVLRTLARQAQINVVVSPQIVGPITLRVEGKTPREVIDVVCQANGYVIDELKGVFYIKTQAERSKEPTESQQYTFSYASAEKMVALLQGQLSSPTIPQFDPRTNTIFYRETKPNIPKIVAFLKGIDTPTQQVMIEARLVEVNANPKQSYGINWSGVVGGSTSPQTFRYGGSGLEGKKVDNKGVPVLDSLPTITTPTAGSPTQFNDFVKGGSKSNFLQTLAGQFAILSLPQMSATLRLLNEDTDAEFLANPRVVAANNEKATIKITRTQPVPQLNFNEQTAQAVFGGFQDKEFGNTLIVTPNINKDNFVSLDVKPEISNKVGDATFVFGGATVASPIIDKRTFDSHVLVKSGDTLAIGGLLQDEVSKSRTKVPIVGDIPLFGYLFQEKVSSRTKRNLLVFVTPTIIKQGYGTGLEDQASGLAHSGEEYADPNGWRNNAKGAIRIIPNSNRQLAADYAKPGLPPLPRSKYKVNATTRE